MPFVIEATAAPTRDSIQTSQRDAVMRSTVSREDETGDALQSEPAIELLAAMVGVCALLMIVLALCCYFKYKPSPHSMDVYTSNGRKVTVPVKAVESRSTTSRLSTQSKHNSSAAVVTMSSSGAVGIDLCDDPEIESDDEVLYGSYGGAITISRPSDHSGAITGHTVVPPMDNKKSMNRNRNARVRVLRPNQHRYV